MTEQSPQMERAISVYRALLLDPKWDLDVARAMAIDRTLARIKPPEVSTQPSETERVFLSDIADVSDLAFLRAAALEVFLTMRTMPEFHRAVAGVAAALMNDDPERLFERSWGPRQRALDNGSVSNDGSGTEQGRAAAGEAAAQEPDAEPAAVVDGAVDAGGADAGGPGVQPDGA